MQKGDDKYSSLLGVDDTLPSNTKGSITCHLHVHTHTLTLFEQLQMHRPSSPQLATNSMRATSTESKDP